MLYLLALLMIGAGLILLMGLVSRDARRDSYRRSAAERALRADHDDRS